MASLSLIRRSRKNGITQLKDGTEYEIQRIRRIKRKKELNRAALQAAAAANVEVSSGAISYRGAFQRFSTIITPTTQVLTLPSCLSKSLTVSACLGELVKSYSLQIGNRGAFCRVAPRRQDGAARLGVTPQLKPLAHQVCHGRQGQISGSVPN